MTQIGRWWFAFALVASVLGLQALTAIYPAFHQDLVQAFGVSGPDIARMEVYRLLVSPLVQTRPGFVGTVWITLLFVAPLAAWRLGAWRSAAVYFLSDWAGTLLILVAMGAESLMGINSAHQHWITRDVGSSSGVYALGLAVALTLPPRLRVAVVAAIVSVFLLRLAVVGRVYDYQHALSLGAAFALVRLMSLRRVPEAAGAPYGERRSRAHAPRVSLAEDKSDRRSRRT